LKPVETSAARRGEASVCDFGGAERADPGGHPRAKLAGTIILLLMAAALPSPASADDWVDDRPDGVYRRWDTDFALDVAVGGGLVARDGTRGTVEGALRLRVVDAAGPMVGARWGPDDGYLMAGIEVRPFWPALLLLGYATGSEWLDLFVQSFAVELGAVWTGLGNDASPGLGFAAGMSVELPLMRSSHRRGALRRFALRLQMRRVWARARMQAGPDEDRSEWSATTGLVFTFGVGSSTVTREPRRYRLR